jgi:DNA-binding IclR family transcriptional regulator
VPVRDPDGRLIASFGIAVPTRRFKHQLPTLAKVLRDVGIAASHEIARLIGESPPRSLDSRTAGVPVA